VPNPDQNVLDRAFNEPILTARRVPMAANKRYNGLTAQLNIEKTDYKIVTSNNGLANPNWNKIRFSLTGGVNVAFNLFDFDDKDIAKYATIAELVALLDSKMFAATGLHFDFNLGSVAGIGIKAGGLALTIDLTAQGWEWLGFVPTNIDTGFGINKISNFGFTASYLFTTGPVPPCSPHDMHFAKIGVRYRLLTQRPR
jgi:hypothetical protein